MRWIFLFAASTFLSVAHADAGFAKLQSGPLPVGWKVVQQYDHSRSFRGRADRVTGRPTQGELARPMQTLVWYPAEGGGTPVRYSDYVRTQASDEDFSRSSGDIDQFLAASFRDASARIGPGPAHAAFDQRMWAVQDAAALPGKYPVVVYAPGIGGTAHEVADIAEYLASHGYVVLASRSLGTHAGPMNDDAEGIESQAGDLQFLLSYARTLAQADMDRVAAMGWSWGGMANLFAGARDSRIDALVSLDGTREPEHTRRIPPARLVVPWLYVQRRPETVAQLNRAGIETSFSLLNEAKYADVYQLVMQPMQHLDFSSAVLRFQRPGWFDEYSREEVEQAYGWTVRYVREFLDAYLKNSPGALAFLDHRPVENGVPAHMASIEHAPAAPNPPPSREGFAAALAQQGFARADTIYAAMRQANQEFVLSENEINQWGYQLLAVDSDPTQAIAMFAFGTRLYPDNANLHDSLGEAYEIAKDPARAAASYRRSLALDPGNAHARDRLAALKGRKRGSD